MASRRYPEAQQERDQGRKALEERFAAVSSYCWTSLIFQGHVKVFASALLSA